ncbi:MAG: prepilin peptidase [Arcobacter sp.]|nr:prepilin peptidase [Arcobacter sp.]
MVVFSFIFGVLIGSFLNVLIVRLPQKKDIVFLRSHCSKCKHTLSWSENIPLISYIFLKGRCSSCKEKISFQYFFVEFISGLLSLFLYLYLGLGYELLYMALFIYLLITLSFIDFKYKAVPDYLLLLAFILSFFASNFTVIESFKNAFLFAGAFVLLNFVLTFYVQNIKAKLLKDETLKTQEALGEGDIPIIAAFGIILGVEGTLVAIFLSAIFAIIPSLYASFLKKDIQTPFIPYLSLGFLVEYFFHFENIIKVFS